MIFRTATVGWSRGRSSGCPSWTIGCTEPPCTGRLSIAAAASTPGSACGCASARCRRRWSRGPASCSAWAAALAASGHCADRSPHRRFAAPRDCAASRRRPSGERRRGRPRTRSTAVGCGCQPRLRCGRLPSARRSARSGPRAGRAVRRRGWRPRSMRRLQTAGRVHRSKSPPHEALDRPATWLRPPGSRGRTAGRRRLRRSPGRASVSSCWKTRPRPAPSADLIASSLRRPRPRANSRFPTFAQAISSTSATAASSVTSVVRMSPTISSCSGTIVAPQPALACG